MSKGEINGNCWSDGEHILSNEPKAGIYLNNNCIDSHTIDFLLLSLKNDKKIDWKIEGSRKTVFYGDANYSYGKYNHVRNND